MVVDCGVEGIVGSRNVMRQSCGEKFCFRPIPVAEGVGKALAIEADLPGEHTISLDRPPSVFRNSGGIDARKSREREWAVVVELNELIVLLGEIPGLCLVGIDDMPDEKLAVGLEEGLHLVGKRIDSLIGDQALGVVAPTEGGRDRSQDEQEQHHESDEKPEAHQRFSPPTDGGAEFFAASSLCRRP